MGVLAEELKTNAPDRIAFVSFTRKGTYEGVERARALGGFGEDDLPYFRTLHSIAFRAGEYSKYDMISKHDYKEFSDAMGMRFSGYYTEEFYNNDDKYLFMCFMRRNNPAMAEIYLPGMDLVKLREVESNFLRYKAFAKVHDFTDIIERFCEVGKPLPVDVAIIDEAQDLTTLQWKMCEVAFRDCKKVYVAGDDDQAIYEWSGADVGYFLGIKASRVEVLGKSYRLRAKVLDLAKRVSSRISQRVDKQFDPVDSEGEVRVYNSVDEVQVNRGETWYFIARNNWLLQAYREFLRRGAFTFIDKDKMSFEPRQIEAINTFEAARKRGRMTDSDEVKLKLYTREGATLSSPWYDNMNFDNDTIAYYKDLIRTKADLKSQRITVNTIHGVKGGEADNVVLMLDFTRAVRMNMERNPDSELRCLYVALTRAKKTLHIIHSTTKNGYDSYIKI